MKAMVLDGIRNLREESEPLRLTDVEVPRPGEGEVLLKVHACGVCHTELDEIEGRTAPPSYPVILGHEIVGTVEARGKDALAHQVGDRVGVGWIHSSCGICEYCRSGNQNLCPEFKATGRDADGGYAEYMTVPEVSAHGIPDVFSDVEAAPLMCAGAIGYRSLRLAGIQNGQTLGLTGFGGSGHLVLKMVGYRYPDTDVYVFARSPSERKFALELGAVWAGDTADTSPVGLHAIIDTTPAWKPVVEAMRNLRPGGRLVVNAIRKEAGDQSYLQRLDYAEHLWMEKEIKSVANVAHGDISGFLDLAAAMGSKPETQEFALEDANRALLELKAGDVRGAKVLRML
jgi:propanol-preferring alcohol dehydrogenase